MAKNIVGMISHLGSNIPLAVGAALGKRMQGEDAVAMTYIGDGGSSIGDFHEGLNFAAVHKAPFVLVIENNQYAYSTPTKLQFKCENLSDRAVGYGIKGMKAFGADVVKVYQAAKEAVDHARSGRGPVLLELETMRFRGHSEHDNFEYVPRKLLKKWEPYDPVRLYRNYLLENNIFTKKKLDNIDDAVRQKVDEAAEWAYEQPFPEGESILEGLYRIEEVDNG
jgi:TPP-dependent pyruvate/acetoin dehydrogenase alpha subunit